jgi:hypothetical protein
VQSGQQRHDALFHNPLLADYLQVLVLFLLPIAEGLGKNLDFRRTIHRVEKAVEKWMVENSSYIK